MSVATVLASAVAGGLVTWSLWTDGTFERGGLRRRLVPGLLSLHAGAALVVGTVTAAAAVRSWQLVDRDPQQEAASALLDVSRVDGDRALYALLVLLLVATTGCLTLLLAQSARFAATDDGTQRSVACGVLGLEIGLCGLGLARLVIGGVSAPALLAVAHLPVLITAMVLCWPPHPDAAVAR